MVKIEEEVTDVRVRLFYVRVFLYIVVTSVMVLFYLGSLLLSLVLIIEADLDLWFFVFGAPLILLALYLINLVFFSAIHGRVVIPVFIMGQIREGTFHLYSKQGALLAVKFSADQIARYMLRFIDFIPIVPNVILRPFVYRCYGLKVGRGTYIARDANVEATPLITIGDHSFLGRFCILSSHIIKNSHMIVRRIEVGDHVLIGAYSMIAPGSKIGSHATVGAGAIIPALDIPEGCTVYSESAKILERKPKPTEDGNSSADQTQ